MINVHSHHFDPSASVVVMQSEPDTFEAIRQQYPGCVFSLGLHPWRAGEEDEAQLEHMTEILSIESYRKSIVFIGECGLDKIRNADRMQEQQLIFQKQISLAQQFHLPLIIHSVRAHQECATMLALARFELPVVFHGWNNKFENAGQLVNNGYYFSFGKALMNPESPAADVIRRLPGDRILLETDDSKEQIETIYAKASEILKLTTDQLHKKLSENYSQLIQS